MRIMNRPLWDSLFALYGIHICNYIVPLLTVPYLTHVLGVAEWGALAYAEAYCRYLILVIEFGFQLSATRAIARIRNDSTACGAQISAVLGAQALLAIGALLFTCLLIAFVPIFRAQRAVILIAFLWAVGQSLSPIWFFQGLERVRLMAALNIGANIAALAATFFLVRTHGDGWIAMALRAGLSLVATVIGIAIAHRITPFGMPSPSQVWQALSESSSLFLMRSGVSMYTTANVLILGLVARPAVVGWFAAAEKISRAAAAGTTPMSQAFYPRISHLLGADPRHAAATVRLSALIGISLGMLTSCVLFFGAQSIVTHLLGPGFRETIPVLRILAPLPFVISITNVVGIQWMLPLRLDKEFTRFILAGGVLNIALSVVLAPRAGAPGSAVSLLIVEIVIMALPILFLRFRKLDPWRSDPVREAA